jgi:hypothetical protein
MGTMFLLGGSVLQIGICFVAMRRHYRKRLAQDPGKSYQFDWKDRDLWVTRAFLYSGIIFFLCLLVRTFFP